MPVGIEKIKPRDTNLQADAAVVVIPFGGKMNFRAYLYKATRNKNATIKSIKWLWVEAKYLDELKTMSQKEKFEHWGDWTIKNKEPIDIYGIGIDYAKAQDVMISDMAKDKEVLGKRYWLEAFIYYPEFKLPTGRYFVVKGEPSIVSACFEGAATGKDKNLIKSQYGKTANILIHTHSLPDIAAGYHNYVVFEVDIYNHEKDKKVTPEPFRSVVNFAEAASDFNTTIKVSVILEDNWRNETAHNNSDEYRHYYPVVKAIHYHNKDATYNGATTTMRWRNAIGAKFTKRSPNGEMVAIAIEKEDWETEYWWENIFGRSPVNVRVHAAQYAKKEITFKATDSKREQIPVYVKLPYTTQNEAIRARSVAAGLMMAEVNDREYTCKNYDPCKFTGIDVKAGKQNAVTIFDENEVGSTKEVTDQTSKIFSFIAGDTKKEKVVITLKDLTISDHNAGDGYKCDKDEAHSVQTLVDPAKVRPQWLQNKALPNPDNHSTYEVKGNTIELEMGYQFATAVLAGNAWIHDDDLDTLWVEKYLFLWKNLAQNYVLPISTCRYPNQRVLLTVYPNIEWFINFKFNTDKPVYVYQNKNYKSKPHDSGEDRQKKGSAYGRERASMRHRSKYDIGIVFGYVLNGKTYDLEISTKHIVFKTINFFLQAHESLNRLLMGDESKAALPKAKVSRMSERTRRGLPIRIDIKRPAFSAGIHCKYLVSQKNPEQLGWYIKLALEAKPLLAAEGRLDLLFFAQFIPVAGQFITALNRVIDGVELLSFGAVNIDYHIDLLAGAAVNVEVKPVSYHSIDGWNGPGIYIESTFEIGLGAGGSVEFDFGKIEGKGVVEGSAKAKFKAYASYNDVEKSCPAQFDFEGLEALVTIRFELNVDDDGGKKKKDAKKEDKPYRIPLLDAIKGPKFELFKA